MKIYIVSFQSKENNETKNTYLFWTRAVVCTRARQEGPLWLRRKHLIFSGAFSSGARLRPFSSVSVQDLSWSVCVSQFEKGSCFLFLLSHSKGRHSKTPKTNKQKPHQNQALGCLGAWTCWFSSGSRGVWQTHLAPSSCCSMDRNHSTCEQLCQLLRVLPSSPLLFLVLGRYWKFQIFKAISVFSVYIWRVLNGPWPNKVQHLPHTDTGPFPVLGVSVFCWSNSNSNFKMFSAAMSWQNSTFFPIPWLIRGGWEEQFIRDTNSVLFGGKSLYSTWNPWALEG